MEKSIIIIGAGIAGLSACYSDLDRLVKRMKELAPEDSGVIHEFIGTARAMSRFNWNRDNAPELYTPLDYLRMMIPMKPFPRFAFPGVSKPSRNA
jgi:hypothetical protein